MKRILAIVLLSYLTYVKASNSYVDYQVLRTEPLNKVQASILTKYMLESQVDFWKEPMIQHGADIMVSPHQFSEVSALLSSIQVSYSVMIPNVASLIEEVKSEGGSDEMNWTKYHSHDVINKFIDDLAKNHSDWIQTVSIGQTYEGRDMRVLQISKAGPSKPIVWMEAGIHAREWIASAVATYVIHQIVTSSDDSILNELNFHILPNANPDGYTFSRTYNRLWRKTRSSNAGSKCKGTDPNRNWDFHWNEAGVSSNPCKENYPGYKAFSEIETLNIKNYLTSLQTVPILSHCFHSYSQLWLWPFGYDLNVFPENYEENKALAEEAVQVLKAVHGTDFKPINSGDFYPASGASDDWYKGVLKSRFSYTTELRDTGSYGFLLPANQIIPSGQEMWAALQFVFKEIIKISKDQP